MLLSVHTTAPTTHNPDHDEGEGVEEGGGDGGDEDCVLVVAPPAAALLRVGGEVPGHRVHEAQNLVRVVGAVVWGSLGCGAVADVHPLD